MLDILHVAFQLNNPHNNPKRQEVKSAVTGQLFRSKTWKSFLNLYLHILYQSISKSSWFYLKKEIQTISHRFYLYHLDLTNLPEPLQLPVVTMALSIMCSPPADRANILRTEVISLPC